MRLVECFQNEGRLVLLLGTAAREDRMVASARLVPRPVYEPSPMLE